MLICVDQIKQSKLSVVLSRVWLDYFSLLFGMSFNNQSWISVKTARPARSHLRISFNVGHMDLTFRQSYVQ